MRDVPTSNFFHTHFICHTHSVIHISISDMIDDYDDDDTHYCIKCHQTIIGLDIYVSHRKAKCGKQLQGEDVEEFPEPRSSNQISPPEGNRPLSLKADDFFSSLELQSSSKKLPVQSSTGGKSFTGILTRSKTLAAIQSNPSKETELSHPKPERSTWVDDNQLRILGGDDNQSKLSKQEQPRVSTYKADDVRESDESGDNSEEFYLEDDSDDDNQDNPPTSHTGGKWKPSSPVQWQGVPAWNVQPSTFTGCKWKSAKLQKLSPPPTHTKGKWKPSSPDERNYDVSRPNFVSGRKWSSTKSLLKPPPSVAGKDKWKKTEDASYGKNFDHHQIFR